MHFGLNWLNSEIHSTNSANPAATPGGCTWPPPAVTTGGCTWPPAFRARAEPAWGDQVGQSVSYPMTPMTVGHVSKLTLMRFQAMLYYMAVCQNLVPLVNIKIAGKWMFIPLKMVLIGIDPYPYRSI